MIDLVLDAILDIFYIKIDFLFTLGVGPDIYITL